MGIGLDGPGFDKYRDYPRGAKLVALRVRVVIAIAVPLALRRNRLNLIGFPGSSFRRRGGYAPI
jgi:hypothetical protein